MKDRRVLLFSGGLDSLIHWRLLDRPRCLYIVLEHRYQEDELRTLARLDRDLEKVAERLRIGVLQGPNLSVYEGEDAHIPLRNLILSTLATLNADVIYLGAVAGEASRDKSRRFLSSLSRTLSLSEGRKIQVVAPFRHLTKTQLVKRYLKTYSPDLLKETRSCYTPDVPAGFKGCGKCNACFRRWVAMSLNGIEEAYLEDPVYYGLLKLSDKRGLLDGLMKADPYEWVGILRNNLDAYRAIEKRRKDHVHNLEAV